MNNFVEDVTTFKHPTYRIFYTILLVTTSVYNLQEHNLYWISLQKYRLLNLTLIRYTFFVS